MSSSLTPNFNAERLGEFLKKWNIPMKIKVLLALEFSMHKLLNIKGIVTVLFKFIV